MAAVQNRPDANKNDTIQHTCLYIIDELCYVQALVALS